MMRHGGSSLRRSSKLQVFGTRRRANERGEERGLQEPQHCSGPCRRSARRVGTGLGSKESNDT